MESYIMFDDLCNLHEEAVLCYSKGLYENASAIFARNFEQIHGYLQQPCCEEGGDNAALESSSTSPFYLPIHQQQQEEQQQKQLVFHLPLHHGHRHGTNDYDRYSIERLAFTSVYNLALSTHMAALTTNKTIQCTVRAVKLWELVYNLSDRDGLDLQPVHTLAILTNLGHSYLLSGMEERSYHCYHTILGVLQIIRENKEEVTFESFFMSTAQTVLTPDPAAAAA